MPLFDVAGNAGATLFRQSGPMALNTGVTLVAIVTSILTGVAHSPAAGVNVYVEVPTVVVLITAGLQVPLMPLVDIPGSTGATLFWQSAPIASKAGVVAGVTVISIETGAAHCPASGIKL